MTKEYLQFIIKLSKSQILRMNTDHRQLVGLNFFFLRSQIFKGLRMNEKLSKETPSTFSRGVEVCRGLSTKNIDILEKEVWQFPTLKTENTNIIFKSWV